MKNPAYVIGGSLNAVGIIRALGRKKIPVTALHNKRDNLVSATRYADFYISPDPERESSDFIDFLIEKQKGKDQPGVLFPTSDIAVALISKYRKELSQYFRFVLADNELIKELISKEGFNKLANNMNLSVPLTFVINSFEDVEKTKSQLMYPCILKPFYSHQWRIPQVTDKYGWIKVLQVNSADEFQKNYKILSSVDPRLIVQEFIQGDDDCNYSLHTYISNDKEKIISFVGQKIRLEPIHLGVGAFVKSVHEPKIVTMGEEFLISIGYRGMAVINLKKDIVNKKYYGIELNPRFSLWNLLDYHSGIDFANIYYLDSLGLPFSVPTDYKTGIKWFSIEKDISAYIGYRKEKSLTLIDFIKSYQGKKVIAEFSFDDISPFLIYCWNLLKTFISKASPFS